MLNNRRLLFCKETPQDGWFISQEDMQDHQGFREGIKEEEEDRDWEDENIWNLESHNEVLCNWHLWSTSISHKKQTWRKKKKPWKLLWLQNLAKKWLLLKKIYRAPKFLRPPKQVKPGQVTRLGEKKQTQNSAIRQTFKFATSERFMSCNAKGPMASKKYRKF